jgi:outer membrane protein OmpA-like peptidoglycan-associated protein
MRGRLLMSSLKVAGSWCVPAAGLLVGDAGAQWTITMRAMRNPLPLGQCTAVEIVVKDAQGRQAPSRPDGKQVSGWDFDFAVIASAPDAFRLQNDDATRPFICAQAPTAPSATFVAHYPGRQLKPTEIVPGVELRQSIEIAMEGAASAGHPGGYPSPSGQAGAYPSPDPAYASGAGGASTHPAAQPSGGYPGNPSSGGYAGGGYPAGDPAQTATYPQGYTQSPGYQQPSGAPQPSGNPQGSTYPQPSGYPQPAGYPQPSGSPQPSGYPEPSPYPQQSSAYPQPGQPQPAGYPQAGPTQQATVGMAPAPDSGVRTGKQFLQRIVGHAKRRASEVASNTTTHVADAAGDVVGTTLEAGSGVVKSGAGAVTGAASGGVQGVGRSLGVAPTPKDPADVGAALAAGRAVLYGLRFTEGTAMLESSSGPLIYQIAAALSRTPGQFLIEAHVNGKSGVATQALSEQRAAAVKAALVAAGSSPMQLAALGYGATRPIPGAKSSARIEIARTQ